MIELKNDSLVVSFPDVHHAATLTIDFQRTLRIPDDHSTYALPPGLGSFPLRHVDDFATGVPPNWLEHGGVMFPMYQSEAMWICFHSSYDDERLVKYPFAVKVATGKLCAASGKPWRDGLSRRPQNYLVAPEQPWLDGYCVEKGTIRQFVAMPLGAGYSAEEQITGEAEHGGLQIQVYPMKRSAFEQRFPIRPVRENTYHISFASKSDCMVCEAAPCGPDMGLAPGGKMKQEIYRDPYPLKDWDLDNGSRCFVHIANSMVWQSITGTHPPTPAPTAKSYTEAGLPWFDWYDDKNTPISGTKTLGGLKSVAQLGHEKADVPLPENESVSTHNVKVLRAGLRPGQVREW